MKTKWCALLMLAACGDDAALTELVLSADSDLTLDSITFEIAADGEPTKTAQAARNKGPSYVSIVREEGPLGPVSVTARGMFQNRELLHRTHVVEFVPGESLLVALDLYARCVDAICVGAQTCAANGCTPEKLASLPSWSGSPPTPFTHEDAGMTAPPDSGLSMCGTKQVDLSTDADNCGECGHGCWLWENCAAGACVLK